MCVPYQSKYSLKQQFQWTPHNATNEMEQTERLLVKGSPNTFNKYNTINDNSTDNILFNYYNYHY